VAAPGRSEESASTLDGDETVHVTASRWWQRRKAELARNTRLDYKWRLEYVLRFLTRETTAQVDVHRVDTFRGELEAAGLSPRSVIRDPLDRANSGRQRDGRWPGARSEHAG
jgi:hypothetical protein